MAAKTDTRISRSYSFTFDEDDDKSEFSKHAKSEGRTLAGLIKYLLTASKEGRLKVSPPVSDTPAAGGPVGGGAG